MTEKVWERVVALAPNWERRHDCPSGTIRLRPPAYGLPNQLSECPTSGRIE